MKRFFCLAAAVFLAFVFCSCSVYSDEELNNTKEYEFDDILDSFEWLDKTPEQAGVSDEYIDGGISVSIKGKLCDEDAEGSVYINSYDSEEPFFEEVHIYCSAVILDELKDQFKEMYGQPYSTGIEPYVESQGGAVYWECYFTGEGILYIGKGDKNDWFELTYKLGEPDDSSMYVKRISVEKVMEDTDLKINFPESEYRDLTVTRLWTEPIVYIFEYTDGEGNSCKVWVSREETDGALPNIVQYDPDWEDHEKWDSTEWIDLGDEKFAIEEMMDDGPGLISWFSDDCVYAAAVFSPVTEEDLVSLKDRISLAIYKE